MRISAPSSSVQSTRSGLRTSMSPTVWMSPAVTVPGPCFFTTMRLGPSPCILMAMSLMLRTMSVTSSRTPAIEENSCSTPSIWTDCTAAPCSEDSRMRRSALPSVRPKPRSSGSATRSPRACGSSPGRHLQLARPDQFLPVLLDRHVVTHRVERRGVVRASHSAPWEISAAADGDRVRRIKVVVRRGGACAAGSHCAGSASRRGST